MKKNKIMRWASALLVLTLLTTCAISGTFAKYVTSTTGNDRARVAYWGFDEQAHIDIDLFDTEYANVRSQTGDNVMAPGTEHDTFVSFHYNDVNGFTAPEVAYTFTIDVETEGNYAELDANPNFYWTLERYDGVVETYDTLAQLVTAMNYLSGDKSGTGTYPANGLPQTYDQARDGFYVGWVWKYEDAENLVAQDMRDTAMGNAAHLDSVSLTLTITAEQID